MGCNRRSKSIKCQQSNWMSQQNLEVESHILGRSNALQGKRSRSIQGQQLCWRSVTAAIWNWVALGMGCKQTEGQGQCRVSNQVGGHKCKLRSSHILGCGNGLQVKTRLRSIQIFKCIFGRENSCILIESFVPKCSVDNLLAEFHIISWCWTRRKPLSEWPLNSLLVPCGTLSSATITLP